MPIFKNFGLPAGVKPWQVLEVEHFRRTFLAVLHNEWKANGIESGDWLDHSVFWPAQSTLNRIRSHYQTGEQSIIGFQILNFFLFYENWSDHAIVDRKNLQVLTANSLEGEAAQRDVVVTDFLMLFYFGHPLGMGIYSGQHDMSAGFHYEHGFPIRETSTVTTI